MESISRPVAVVLSWYYCEGTAFHALKVALGLQGAPGTEAAARRISAGDGRGGRERHRALHNPDRKAQADNGGREPETVRGKPRAGFLEGEWAGREGCGDDLMEGRLLAGWARARAQWMLPRE